MGAGKTSVGLALARLMDWSFVDLDEEIERRESASVAELFAQRGESGFRDAEERCLRWALGRPEPWVVACGGGVTLRGACRRALIASGCERVWLDAPAAALSARLLGDRTRPLLAGLADEAARARTLEALRVQRRAGYAEVATLRLDSSGASATEIARSVEAWLASRANAGAGEPIREAEPGDLT